VVVSTSDCSINKDVKLLPKLKKVANEPVVLQWEKLPKALEMTSGGGVVLREAKELLTGGQKDKDEKRFPQPEPALVKEEAKRAKSSKRNEKATKGKKSGTCTAKNKSNSTNSKKEDEKQKRARKRRPAQRQRKKAAANSAVEAEDLFASLDVGDDELVDAVSGLSYRDLRRLLSEEGEEIIAATVQISRKEALNCPKCQDAETLEKVQLEGLTCWRPIEENEITENDEVIPSCVLYTRKRDGRYKARLVALGNLQRNVGTNDCYSPTVSYAANRVLLTEAAKRKMHLSFFDISNAFIKSLLDPKHRVFVKLPPQWGGATVRLIKALYGLRLAPRCWYDAYANHLIAEGWERNVKEPGLFRKAVQVNGKNVMVYLSIYVDDSLCVSVNKDVLEKEVNSILKRFPGKLIAPVERNGAACWDLLGSELEYRRTDGAFLLHAAPAIEKLLKKCS
jgi:hypothetical protein